MRLEKEIPISWTKKTHKYLGWFPFPVRVTTRTFAFLVGDPELNFHLPILLISLKKVLHKTKHLTSRINSQKTLTKGKSTALWTYYQNIRWTKHGEGRQNLWVLKSTCNQKKGCLSPNINPSIEKSGWFSGIPRVHHTNFFSAGWSRATRDGYHPWHRCNHHRPRQLTHHVPWPQGDP